MQVKAVSVAALFSASAIHKYTQLGRSVLGVGTQWVTLFSHPPDPLRPPPPPLPPPPPPPSSLIPTNMGEALSPETFFFFPSGDTVQ